MPSTSATPDIIAANGCKTAYKSMKKKIKAGFLTVRAMVVLVLPLILISSCEKILDQPDDKKPAELRFEFAMGTHELSDDKFDKANKAVGKFSVESGFISVSNIEFDGRRQEGDDVYFISDFDEPLLIDLSGEFEDAGISFDIPQGIYTMIEVTLHIGTGEHPALRMQGEYRKNVHQSIPVLFNYGYPEQVRIRAKPGSSASNIVFTKEDSSTARVIVETESLFRLVNYGMIVQAETVEIDGKEMILINENTNTGLFNSISARMNNSFTVVIE